MWMGADMSIFVAVSTQKGIVMAADSRVEIVGRNKVVGFHDWGVKLFPFQKFSAGFAFAGSFVNSKVIADKVIADIVQGLEKPARLSDAHWEIREQIISRSGSSKLISVLAGFEDNKFVISYWGKDPKKTYPIEKEIGMICLYVTDHVVQDIDFTEKELLDVAWFLQGFVKGYSAAFENWKGIGGPVDILFVKEEGTSWFKKKSVPNDRHEKGALLRYYREGELPCFRHPEFAEADMVDALEKL